MSNVAERRAKESTSPPLSRQQRARPNQFTAQAALHHKLCQYQTACCGE